MNSTCEMETIARRRRLLSLDYKFRTDTLLDNHNGAQRLVSQCLRSVRRQFLPHYFSPPPRWRVWIRQLQKERALPDFCVIGPAKSGTSDLAVTIMSHPNILHPLVKEFSSHDPLTWRAFYPTTRAVQRHARRHGVALCPFVGPYLHFLDLPIILSAYCPHIKIVINLRNPVDLVFSLWKSSALSTEKQVLDKVPFLSSFPAYVDLALELIHEVPGPLSGVLHCGIYAIPVTHWVRAFGRQNVCIFDVADYFRDRNSYLERLERFLRLPHAPFPPQLPVANRNPLDHAALDTNTSTKLRQFFEPFNRRLWDVIGTEYTW